MKTVWKYELNPEDCQTIMMPKGAKILAVKVVGEDISANMYMWAEVDNEEEQVEKRLFEIFGTGHVIHCDMGVSRVYLDTVIMRGGTLVWHIYERLT